MGEKIDQSSVPAVWDVVPALGISTIVEVHVLSCSFHVSTAFAFLCLVSLLLLRDLVTFGCARCLDVASMRGDSIFR
jgi:hypothetical protein